MNMLPENIRPIAAAFVAARVAVDPSTGCWNWTAHLIKKGYGRTTFQGKAILAHRLSYMAHVGEIPGGALLDHFRCDNPRCVNPEHVRPSTSVVNTMRSVKTSAYINATKTHCVNGHPLSGDNLGKQANGNRKCIACERASSKRYKARNAEAVRLAAREKSRRDRAANPEKFRAKSLAAYYARKARAAGCA